jgi:hypothetical protein
VYENLRCKQSVNKYKHIIKADIPGKAVLL